MTKALVWVEHDGSAVKDATLSAVSAAAQLGEVTLLVAGAGVDGVAQAAARIAGVAKVVTADDASLAHALAENVAPLVAGLMADYDAFVAPATTTGKNVAPRVAALLDVMQISDILSVEGPKTFTRPIYAGNAIATVESGDAKLVITVRGTAFAKAAADGGSAAIEAVGGAADAGTSSFVGSEIAKSERPELTSAKIIVSGARAEGRGDVRGDDRAAGGQAGRGRGREPRGGGRGLCAQRLPGGPDGQDRRPRSLHRRRHLRRHPAPGRHEGSKTIIAINKDEDAPIFQVADIGLVGDLFTLVPELTGKL
jgi:electron transfer flavoprotein alpha subunit